MLPFLIDDADVSHNSNGADRVTEKQIEGFKATFTEAKNSQKIVLEQTKSPSICSLYGVVRLTEVGTTTAAEQFSNDQNQATKGAKITVVTAEVGAETVVTADTITADAGTRKNTTRDV
ncbi:hypothetical protein A4A49_15527 [Nicotiana attenuata]|uniref:Uncharacterized protein n=1 Tax=Nicotiana attenuata TaxID=49451 RepID=A0A314KWK0_NICAT|nr:hypothetical protein A4A49_15527 [Nicotiana attenuata]